MQYARHYSTLRISALSEIRKKEKKNVLIKIMVTKSFDYYLGQFNFLNTCLEKKTRGHMS